MRWARATGRPARGSSTNRRRVPMPVAPRIRSAIGFTLRKSYTSQPSTPSAASASASAAKSKPSSSGGGGGIRGAGGGRARPRARRSRRRRAGGAGAASVVAGIGGGGAPLAHVPTPRPARDVEHGALEPDEQPQQLRDAGAVQGARRAVRRGVHGDGVGHPRDRDLSLPPQLDSEHGAR